MTVMFLNQGYYSNSKHELLIVCKTNVYDTFLPSTFTDFSIIWAKLIL